MSVELSAEAAVRGGTLRVAYRVDNATGGPIHLINAVQRWSAAGLSTDPGNVYTEVVGGALRLTKANLPIPDHLDVEAPDVPLLTRVEAGGAFAEEMALPLPLAPYHPYDEVERSDKVITYDVVELAIGWLPSAVEVRAGTRPDGARVISAAHRDVVREQRLLVAPLPVSVPTHIVARAGR